jgi:hypothetical protein
MNKACIHVDLDGLEYIIKCHPSQNSTPSDKCLINFFSSAVENSLILFNKFNVKATYFLIASDLDNETKLSLGKKITTNGHDIGSHGFFHKKLSSLKRTEKEHEIISSKKKIEDQLGIEVKGFRAPSFLLDRDSIDLISEAGYCYDSSLFLDQVPKYSKNRYLLLNGVYELFLPRLASLLPPLHASYTYLLSSLYLKFSLKFYRGYPLVYLFHLTDFSERISFDENISFFLRLAANTYRKGGAKLRHCNKLLSIINEQYKVVRSLNIIDEIKEGR